MSYGFVSHLIAASCFHFPSLSKYIPDEKYLNILFRGYIGEKMDWDNPVTFNQKMQWLKMNDRRNIYTVMVDKIRVKEFISKQIGSKYVVQTYGTWDDFDEIDFNSLPNQFVLKTNHGCGGMVICKNKDELNIQEVKKKIQKSYGDNYFWYCREWPYKNVKRKVFAEEYMQNGNQNNLVVYKIFNFSGKPELIQVIQDDKTKYETIDYFDTKWNLLDLRQNYPNSIHHLAKPETLEEMLELAGRLSQGIPFVRTDFYEVNGKVIFSEFTFFSDAGFAKFYPRKWDDELGALINLSLAKKEV